jgi:hypothetical protein
MFSHFCRWLAPLLLVAATLLPVHAQVLGPGQSATESEKEKVGHVPALQYTVAFLFVALVMVILCKPSRKA